MGWEIVYCDEIQDWLDSLDKQQLKRVAKELRLLELCGNELKLPHSRSLGSGLFELRERHYGYRIYYTFEKQQLVVLLKAGDKSTQTKDIKLARKLLAEYRKQSDEN